MPSKLGLHIHTPSPMVDQYIRSAPWAAVKALDNTSPLWTAQDAGIPIRVLRLYKVEKLDAPSAALAFLGKDLTPVTHIQLVCEDPKSWDWPWQEAVIGSLQSSGYKGKFLLGGFSTGVPSQVTYPGGHIGPHFPEWLTVPFSSFPPGSLFALDQYVGTTIGTPLWSQWIAWTGTRDALIRSCLRQHGQELPYIIITESGIDSVIPGVGPSPSLPPGSGGWLNRSISPTSYAATLIGLDRLDVLDDGVLARCIFTVNALNEWAPYNVDSILDQVAAHVRASAAQAATPTATAAQPVEVQGSTAVDVGRYTAPPVGEEIAAVPLTPVDFKQDPYSADCWIENGRRFGSRYFQPPDLDTFFQMVKRHPRPTGGEPANFDELESGLRQMCAEHGVELDVPSTAYVKGHRYLQILQIKNDSDLGAALDDPDTTNPWSNILSVHGKDLGLTDDSGNPVTWDHYITAVRWATRPTTVVIYDPASLWDHIAGSNLPLSEVEVACHDVSWFPYEGRGYKVVTA